MSGAGTLQELEARLRGVEAVGEVVHAVWAIAQAQLPQTEAAVAEASHYLDWVDSIVERVVGRSWHAEADAGGALTLVVGPERAFCGALAREVLAEVPGTGDVGLVGRRFSDAAMARPAVRSRVAFALSGPGSVDEVEPVAEAIAAEVLRHAGDRAVLVTHPRGGRASSRSAVLLPSPGRQPARELPDHYSSADVLLADAARERATGRLFTALSETLYAEVLARVKATEHARHAIDDRRDSLGRTIRVLRQEGITAELLELFAGVDADSPRRVAKR